MSLWGGYPRNFTEEGKVGGKGDSKSMQRRPEAEGQQTGWGVRVAEAWGAGGGADPRAECGWLRGCILRALPGKTWYWWRSPGQDSRLPGGLPVNCGQPRGCWEGLMTTGYLWRSLVSSQSGRSAGRGTAGQEGATPPRLQAQAVWPALGEWGLGSQSLA